MSEVSLIYGPVPSRRLGLSLGIDLVPYKTCTYNCIYCQLGRTTTKTIRRRIYLPPKRILRELKESLKKNKRVDFITFSGSGEPTLNSKIGYLIRAIKKFTKIPVAVITNGALLYKPSVQQDLLLADVVLPTLTTANLETFKRIHCGHPLITLKKTISGLIEFRKKYKGEIWLEIMLIKGFNDNKEELEGLKKIISQIKPERVQLNTVVRPPSDDRALPLLKEELLKIKKYLGNECEIIVDFKEKKGRTTKERKETLILNLLARRPVTLNDITNVLRLNRNEAVKILAHLIADKKVRLVNHQGIDYYRIKNY